MQAEFVRRAELQCCVTMLSWGVRQDRGKLTGLECHLDVEW